MYIYSSLFIEKVITVYVLARIQKKNICYSTCNIPTYKYTRQVDNNIELNIFKCLTGRDNVPMNYIIFAWEHNEQDCMDEQSCHKL